MKILSLFNGMNCIGLALHELGIEFELYASEIDKYANKVSNTLFPDTIELGDVTKIDVDSLPVFDLVVGGSPCQGFSFAGKQLNFEDERSKLFFDFVKILEACKKKNPNVKYILENVKMKSEYEAVISRFMGIDPIQINSALLSAQNRVRLYWTNIGTTKRNLFGIEEPGIQQPKDKGILLKDILEGDVGEKYFLSEKMFKCLKKREGTTYDTFYPANESGKARTINARLAKMGTGDNYIKVDKKGNIKNNQNKASCFTAGGNSGGNHSNMDILIVKCARQVGRKLIDGKRADNSNVKIKQYIEPRKDDKCGTLTTVQKDNVLILKTQIRRLTPTECARLQTVPEWAIKKMLNCGVSDSQLYKMLGNGWTIEVIKYILSYLNKTK